jgi:hypothetical protein
MAWIKIELLGFLIQYCDLLSHLRPPGEDLQYVAETRNLWHAEIVD